MVAGAFAGAGPRLHGRIQDENGGAVSGAIVRVSSREGGSRTVITDAKGSFAFTQLPPGNYLVEVDAQNFSHQVETASLTDDDRALDFTLRVSAVDEQVVVTATGTPQSVDEISKSVSVINAQQIERRNDLSLTDALRQSPGLRVEQLGGPGAFSKIFIRGLRVVDTSVLVDGFRIRDASDFRGGINPVLEDLLTNNFDRVEVLRGSGSSLYGSNAVGGVVNIVPQEGAGRPRVTVGFDGGSLGILRERAQLSGALSEKFSYSAAATRLDENDGVLGGDIYRNTSLATHLRYQLRPTMSLRGTIIFADGFNRLTDSPFPIGPRGNEFGFATGNGPVAGFVENKVNPDSFRFSDFFTGSIAFSHQLSRMYGYTVSYQSVVTNGTFDNGPDQSETAKMLGIFEFPGKFNSAGRIHTVNFTNNIQAGRYNLITAGVEFERESFGQQFTSPFFSTPRTTDYQHSLAFFGQDQLSLLQGRLQLSAAFRTQGFTVENPGNVPEIRGIDVKRALTGDGSIAYTFVSTGTKLRAHIGNSFRAPSLSERFQLFRGQRIGNPFLRPERGLSVDGGIDQNLLNGKARLSATYFYSRLQEVITSTALFKATNDRGALARGFELSGVASPYRGLDLSSSYTYTNSVQVLENPILRFDNVQLPAGASVPSLSIPRHSFSFEANHRLRYGLNVNFNLYAVSKHDFPLFDPQFFSQVLFSFKGYTKSALGVSYTRAIGEDHEVTFYTKIDNLFDRKIVEEGFRVPGATAYGGIKFRF